MKGRPKPFIDNGDGTLGVPLTAGLVATIDAADADVVAHWSWRKIVSGSIVYAARTKIEGRKRGSVLMHREIMGSPPGLDIDHVNGDGLDNRRANLRLATESQNGGNRRISKNNTSGYKGVYWDKQQNKWGAQICCRRRHHKLGYFETPELAHEAYAEAASRLFGEFARVG